MHLIELIHHSLLAGMSHENIKKRIPFLSDERKQELIDESVAHHKAELQKNLYIIESEIEAQQSNSVMIVGPEFRRATHMIHIYRVYDPEEVDYWNEQVKQRTGFYEKENNG